MSNPDNGGQVFQKFKDLQTRFENSKRMNTTSQPRDGSSDYRKRHHPEADSNEKKAVIDDIGVKKTSEPHNATIIESMSKFRLSERISAPQEVKKRLMAQTFIPIQSVEEHVAKLRQSLVSHITTHMSNSFQQNGESIQYNDRKALRNWATVGVIASDPEERKTSTKAKYSLLKLTNLVDVHLNILLFGKTHESWAHRLRRGMVIGIQKPQLLRPTEFDTVTGLHVDGVNDIFIIGYSKDCAQCEAYLRNDAQCPTTIDRRNGIYCEEHVRKSFKRSKNTRMELASGNITMAFCGATDATDEQGKHVYKVKGGIPAQARNTYKRSSLNGSDNAAYVVDGKGIVTNGKSVNDLLSANNSKESKRGLAEFLSTRNDFGAQMLRRATGLGTDPEENSASDRKTTSAFSAEAIRKIGFNPDASAGQLNGSEKDEKYQAINRLLRREKDAPATSVSQSILESQSDDKYVYL